MDIFLNQTFILKYIHIKCGVLFFPQASERAGCLNPRFSLANLTHVTGPAFYDMAHGPDFFPAQRCI